jgi:hypothetical protein
MTKQVEIRSASFRLLHRTPGHATYGVWINGGKCGNLVVRLEEEHGLCSLLSLGGFQHFPDQPTTLADINERYALDINYGASEP